MIDDILEFNKKFVESKGYEKYITNKYPDKKIAILSCMDTRLTELLPAALGIRNGDVKIIKNAVDRTAKKTLEQTGKILRGYKDTLTEFGSGDVLLITGFNFFYYGNNISLVKRVILNFRRSGAVHKIHEKIIAVRGERFHIRGWFVIFSKGIRNQFPDI